MFKKLGMVFLIVTLQLQASVNQAGQLVTRFGTNGRVVWNLGSSIYPNGLVVDQQQRITIAGGTTGYIARYLSNGVLDRSFNGNGYTFNMPSAVLAIAQLGGTLYVAGQTFIKSFNNDGSVNTQWGVNGTYTITLNNFFVGLAVQQDGKVIVASNNRITRLNTSGTALDTTFNATGTPGYQEISMTRLVKCSVFKDGTIIAAGFTEGIGPGGVFVSQAYVLQQNGNLNSAYNSTGQSVLVNNMRVFTFLRQSTGAIVLIGQQQDPFTGSVKRLTPAGVVDTTFGDGGEIVIPDMVTNGMLTIYDEFFVSRSVFSTPDGNMGITAYTSNGQINRSFGTDGTALFTYTFSDFSSPVIASAQNGAIVGAYDTGLEIMLEECTEYDPGQVGFTDTSPMLTSVGNATYTVSIVPEFKIPVINENLLPEYVIAGLNGF